MKTDWTPAEELLLQEQEGLLREHAQSFIIAGNALTIIWTHKLYRKEHSTFEQYADARWKISRQHAYRLMEASKVQKAIADVGEIPNERIARELVPLPKETRELVAKKLFSGNKPVTVERTKEVIAQVTGSLSPKGDTQLVDAPKRDNSRPLMSAAEKARAFATVDEWYKANWQSLNAHPPATPEVMVRRILALFK